MTGPSIRQAHPEIVRYMAFTIVPTKLGEIVATVGMLNKVIPAARFEFCAIMSNRLAFIDVPF